MLVSRSASLEENETAGNAYEKDHLYNAVSRIVRRHIMLYMTS